eukprot:ANDGO_01016.mRNA.1 ALG-2 interacting protein X
MFTVCSIRQPEKTDFAAPILKYLKSYFGPQVEQNFTTCFNKMSAQRISLASLSRTAQFAVSSSPGAIFPYESQLLSCVVSYLGFLYCVKPHFPITSTSSLLKVKYAWKEALPDAGKARVFTVNDISYEIACVVSVLAAALSNYAAMECADTCKLIPVSVEESDLGKLSSDSSSIADINAVLVRGSRSFQLAAGLYEYLEKSVVPNIPLTDASGNRNKLPPDFSREGLRVLRLTMLGHAQLCAALKAYATTIPAAAADKSIKPMKKATIARLFLGAAQIYNEAWAQSRVPFLSGLLLPISAPALAASARYAMVRGLLTLAIDPTVVDILHHGRKVTLLASARDRIAEASACFREAASSCSLLPQIAALRTHVDSLYARVDVASKQAVSDNEKVYHDKVVSEAEVISPFEASVLVNAVSVQDPLTGDGSVSPSAGSGNGLAGVLVAIVALQNGDPFAGLVPSDVQKAAAGLAQWIDDGMRKTAQYVSDRQATTQMALAPLPLALPAAAGAAGAAGTSKPGKRRAVDILFEQVSVVSMDLGDPSRLSELRAMAIDMRTDIATSLDAVRDTLNAEEEQDTVLRTRYGRLWNRTASKDAAVDIWKRVKDLKERMWQAEASDKKVGDEVLSVLGPVSASPRGTSKIAPAQWITAASNLSDFEELFKTAVLGGAGAGAGPASMAGVDSTFTEDESSAFAKIAAPFLEALERVLTERSALSNQLAEYRDAAVTSVLHTLIPLHGQGQKLQGAVNEYFTNNVTPVLKSVQESLAAEDKIVADLKAKYTEFSRSPTVARVEAVSHEVTNAVAAYTAAVRHVQEGIEFYTSVQDAARYTRRQADDFVAARSVEKEQFEAAFANHPQGPGQPMTGALVPPPAPAYAQPMYAQPVNPYSAPSQPLAYSGAAYGSPYAYQLPPQPAVPRRP